MTHREWVPKGCQVVHLAAVLDHAPQPGLLKSELPLDHPERVLDLRAEVSFGSLDQIIQSSLRRIGQKGGFQFAPAHTICKLFEARARIPSRWVALVEEGLNYPHAQRAERHLNQHFIRIPRFLNEEASQWPTPHVAPTATNWRPPFRAEHAASLGAWQRGSRCPCRRRSALVPRHGALAPSWPMLLPAVVSALARWGSRPGRIPSKSP